MKTADEVWDEILTPQQRVDIQCGRPVHITLTREQLAIIEADPLRQLMRHIGDTISRELDALLEPSP